MSDCRLLLLGFKRQQLVLWLAALLLSPSATNVLLHVDAALACDSDADCRDAFDLNDNASVCLPSDKTCSNRFQEGCLKTLLSKSSELSKSSIDEFQSKSKHKHKHTKRICNSDDNDMIEALGSDIDIDEAEALLPCIRSTLNYPELRIHNGNWESSIFLSWIYQILLMEVVEVPATVGLTTSKTAISSFYSPENTMEYSSVAYPYTSLETANMVHDSNSDCALTEEPCTHVLPEVWGGQRMDYRPFIGNNTIEPVTANGQIGKFSLYVPAFTAKQYPALVSFYGLQGELNRELLAKTFPRPTTWLEYCQEVSLDQCTTTTTIATIAANTTTTTTTTTTSAAIRFPKTENEEGLYFAEGLFTGHFRFTDKNNCTLDRNTSCTGHVVASPCSWSTNIDSQLFWNDIVGLEPDGPGLPNGGYDHATRAQIWRAANATKSNVIMSWYQPEVLVESFFDTDAAFQQVLLPPPIDSCLKKRLDIQARCSEDINERRGRTADGSCDDEAHVLHLLIAKSLGQSSFKQKGAEQSPGHEFIKNIKVTELEINTIFRNWLEKDVDKFGNDAREAVCGWVVDNLDTLLEFVPIGYPKQLSEQSKYQEWYLYAAQGVAGVAGLAALAAIGLCFRYRETQVMVFAQPIFILLILTGFLLNSVGAIMITLEPSQSSCTSMVWFIILGYSIELVPVIVKTAAINSLIHSAKKQKRVNISRQVLMAKVAVAVVSVVAFLTCWTIFDPPSRFETREISKKDPTIIENYIRCGSDNVYWKLMAYAWEVLLLLIAAVLAFQSRSILKTFNDSRTLGVMVYSHFVFVVLRGISSYFLFKHALPSSILAAMFSFNYSLDALVAMIIFVLPKIVLARKASGTYAETMRMSRMSSRVPSKEYTLDSIHGRHLNVLVCTANMGNAEPTPESMEEWIPLGGACDKVQPLQGIKMTNGTFDLIAIGMQESTWKEKAARAPAVKGETISEEEVLHALEDQNTAALRKMIQDILGDDYYPVAEDQRGQMRLYVWGSGNVVEDIEDVQISGANTGIGNVLANKGGIVVTVTYKKSRLSFLSAHLAAHEGQSYYDTRCENIQNILRESKTFDLSQKLDAAVSSHHMFVMGDLNFRTKFLHEASHEENVKLALEFVQANDFEGLYKFDELHKGVKNGDLLVDFKTLPCQFPPTFKVQREEGYVYKEQRTPSYTDRILFKSAEGLGDRLRPLAYEPCAGFITSDHKPVRGAFSIVPIQPLGTRLRQGEVSLAFRKMQCSNLPAADANGSSDPYLMFLWDSVDLVSQDASFKDKVRKILVGKSWPRTKYISKNLNPKWEGEKIFLSTKNPHVGSDAMLFVVAMDYDSLTLKDDFLGALALNVHDLFSMEEGENEKKLSFDRPLQRGGKFAGQIKFKLDIQNRPAYSAYFKTKNDDQV